MSCWQHLHSTILMATLLIRGGNCKVCGRACKHGVESREMTLQKSLDLQDLQQSQPQVHPLTSYSMLCTYRLSIEACKCCNVPSSHSDCLAYAHKETLLIQCIACKWCKLLPCPLTLLSCGSVLCLTDAAVVNFQVARLMRQQQTSAKSA